MTVRLTVAQATVRFLAAQVSERDGVEQPLFAGCFGIFGHGNVAGLGQALLQAEIDTPGALPYVLGRNEQAVVHTAAAYARAKDRLQTWAVSTSVGPGSTNTLTGAALATINRLPVLLLTARDGAPDEVAGLQAGADDYVTKPFAFEELLARIGALGRRTESPGSVLEAGDLRINLLSHRVWRGGKEIELSSREFALLEFLLRNPRQVLSRQQILSAVWDYAFDPGSNVVDVYVRYLRSKLDRRGEPSVIQTVRGAGYRFEPPADAPSS